MINIKRLGLVFDRQYTIKDLSWHWVDISGKQIKKIATLSKLRLEGSELEELTSDFNQIIDFVNKISEIDTDNAGSTNSKEEQTTLREKCSKIPNESHLPIEKIKEIAPQFEAGYFVVPRVIENNG